MKVLDVIEASSVVKIHKDSKDILDINKSHIPKSLRQVKKDMEVLNCDDFDLSLISSKSESLPRATLSSLKSLCDKFGFIIIPMEYYNENCYFDINGVHQDSIKDKVEEIVAANITNSIFYAITPMTNYSIKNHIFAKNDYEMYICPKASSLDSIMLHIPIYRDIYTRIENIETSMSNVQNKIKSIEMQVEKIQNQLNIVTDKQIQQELELKSLARQFVRAIDPILISIDTANINLCDDNKLCTIHYQWGPDFTDNVAQALDLSIKENQAVEFLKIFNNTYNGGQYSELSKTKLTLN